MIKLTFTPLVKTFRSRKLRKSAPLFLKQDYTAINQSQADRTPVASKKKQGYELWFLALSLFSNSLSTSVEPIKHRWRWRRNKADGLWWHTFLLLFDRSKLDPTTKGPTKQMSLSDGLSSQTHWRRFVMHSVAEPFHCFHVHIKTWWPTKWWPIEWQTQMSLSDDLSNQTHWRRFVTHPSVESFQYGNEIFRSRPCGIHPQLTYRVKTQGRHYVTQSNKMIQRLNG